MKLSRRQRNLLLHFYKTTIIINVAVSALGLIRGIGMAMFFFCTIGLLANYIYRETFCKSEYYFYYNAGLFKRHLYGSCFIVNFIISIIILIIT